MPLLFSSVFHAAVAAGQAEFESTVAGQPTTKTIRAVAFSGFVTRKKTLQHRLREIRLNLIRHFTFYLFVA